MQTKTCWVIALMIATFWGPALAAPGDEILGTWQGQIKDERVKPTSFKLNFRRAASGEIEGSVSYPERGCSAMLVQGPNEVRSGVELLTFRERADSASSDCPSGGQVSVRVMNYGSLGYWYYTRQPLVNFHVFLERVGPNPRDSVSVRQPPVATVPMPRTPAPGACPRQSRLNEWVALRTPRLPQVASDPWQRARGSILAAREEVAGLLKRAAPVVPDDLVSGEIYSRLDRANSVAASLTHLAFRVPSIWEVNEVLLIAAAMAETLRLPHQQFDAVFQEFETAVAEVSDNARDLGLAMALQENPLAWIALQERALSGSDPLAAHDYQRILSAATKTAGMRRLLQASRAHGALWRSLEGQRVDLLQLNDGRVGGGRRARYTEAVCDALVSFGRKEALASIEQAFLRLPSDTMPEVRAEQRERTEEAVKSSIRHNDDLNIGTYRLSESRATPPRVGTLLNLAGMRDLDHLGPEIRQELRRVPPEHPLRQRMKELQRNVATAQDELTSSPPASAAWHALRSPDGLKRVGALALAASEGDKKALAELNSQAERVLSTRGLQSVIRVSNAWQLLSEEVYRVWPVNWMNSPVDDLVLYTTLPERRDKALDGVGDALSAAWNRASDRESRVAARERARRDERDERTRADEEDRQEERAHRARAREICEQQRSTCEVWGEFGVCLRYPDVFCD